MNRVFVLCVLCCLLLASCKLEFNDGVIIAPSSNIVKKEFKMKAFDQVDIDVVANVKIVQTTGGDSRVVLSCPDNYVDLFKFDVEGGELDIAFTRDGVNIEPRNVDVTVFTPQLHKLENSNVASVETDRLAVSQLKVENSGVGGVYLSGLSVNRVEVECSGVGGIELKGAAVEAELECSGVGGIDAKQLKAEIVKAEVSGIGGIKCFATKKIHGEVSGVGELQYGGSPQEEKLERSGIGDITKF